MKHITATVFLFYCLLSGIFAQTTFKLAPSPAWISNPPSVLDSPAKSEIVNRTNTVLTLRWQRIIVSVPAGVSTQVCDLNLCYGANISTRTFDLNPLDTGNLDLHFVNDLGVAVNPPAEVHVKITNVNLPTDTFVAVYRYTTVPLSAKGPAALSTVRLFPNPGSTFFALENADDVAAFQLCHLDGRVIRRIRATPGLQYDAADLPSGTYLIALENEKGTVLRTLEWQRL